MNTGFAWVLAGSRMYTENKTLASRIDVHEEINNMLREKFGSIPDKWIFSFSHASLEKYNFNRSNKQENSKFILYLIYYTVKSYIRWRQLPSRKALAVISGWLKRKG